VRVLLQLPSASRLGSTLRPLTARPTYPLPPGSQLSQTVTPAVRRLSSRAQSTPALSPGLHLSTLIPSILSRAIVSPRFRNLTPLLITALPIALLRCSLWTSPLTHHHHYLPYPPTSPQWQWLSTPVSNNLNSPLQWVTKP
jgi:hypothetical protein